MSGKGELRIFDEPILIRREVLTVGAGYRAEALRERYGGASAPDDHTKV